MRIGLNIPGTQPISTKPSSAASANHTGSISADEADTFSGDTVSLNTLASRALQSPEIRADKVSGLQQDIDAGLYRLDPKSIAASMLGE